jgi:hypothetical protein
VTVADLSTSERQLWEAFPRGAWVDLRDGSPESGDLGAAESWGPDRVVRADVIRALLLGAREAEPGLVPGVRLRGARVTGRLDLTGASIPWLLTCTYCYFEEEILLVESAARAVRITHSRFPAFSGTRMRVDGIVSLEACSGAAVVRLDLARVIGQVCLRDATFGADISALAVCADGMSVDGEVDCAGLSTRGAVSMQGLQVTGSVDLTGAQVAGSRERALAAGNASIGGRLIGRGLRVDGEMLLHDTTVTRIELTGACLRNPDGLALSGGGLTVRGGMFLSGGFTAHGQVWLVGVRLGANLSFGQATLANPGNAALNLDRATIGNLDGSDLDCSGWISLVGARVASDLSLERARITSGGEHAVVADGALIEGTLLLAEMRADGEVAIRTGRVGQRLILTGAQLENPAGTALALSGTEIASDLDLVRTRLQGIVDLSHVHVGVLRDDPSCWPGQLNLDGLTYSALEPRLPARQRLRWLARHQHGDQLQPYEQLAAHYDGLGQPTEARRILYARERLQRGNRSPAARTWSFLQDITVAYGYQPWRALLWLAFLLTAGSVLFALHPPPPLQEGAAPHFNSVVYTLDLLLPVVDLGQKHAFNPAGTEQWFAYLLIAAGWILATTIAAGAARVLSRR